LGEEPRALAKRSDAAAPTPEAGAEAGHPALHESRRQRQHSRGRGTAAAARSAGPSADGNGSAYFTDISAYAPALESPTFDPWSRDSRLATRCGTFKPWRLADRRRGQAPVLRKPPGRDDGIWAPY